MIWYVEDGIGEERAIRLERGEIAEARMHWPGTPAAGLVADARLVSRRSGSPRGTAELADGTQVLVGRLPREASEGAIIRLELVRPALVEAGRTKLARARPTAAQPRPAPSLAERLAAEERAVRTVRRFPEGDWDALIADACAREVAFEGGTLSLSPTPAMTLIDIDGELDPRSLALAACEPIARALRRLDIGGSIGIDFPTLPDKAHRREVDAALARALAGLTAPWPHERTAMNGFGFVQLVAKAERVSILHRATLQCSGVAARLLLRRAEALEGAGTIALTAHPALEARLKPVWLDELRRRTGRAVTFHADSALAIEAPHAQMMQP